MTPTPPPSLTSPSHRNRDARRLAVAIGVAALLWFYMFSPWTSGLTNFWLTMAGSAVILTTLALLSSRPNEARSSASLEMTGQNPPMIFQNGVLFNGDDDSVQNNTVNTADGSNMATDVAENRHFQIFHYSGNIWKCLFSRSSVFQLFGGVALAFALWGIFWVGDKASAWLFDFARPEVDAVYAMKQGLPAWLIAVLLLVLIGPAEELFWRGYVQRTFGRLFASRTPAPAAQTAAESRARTAAFVVTTAIYALVHIWSFNFMLVMAALVAGAVWGLIYRLCPRSLPALVISHALWDALVFVCLPI